MNAYLLIHESITDISVSSFNLPYLLSSLHQTFSNGLWKCVGKLPNAHASTIFTIAYAPAKAGHGRIASGGADNRIQIYREVVGSTSDQPLFALDVAVEGGDNSGDVNCVSWHPFDPHVLCSASDDGSIRLWKFTT